MFRTSFICLLAFCAALSGFAASIWVEGEDAVRRKNKSHPWWYDKVKPDALSGGAWISHFDKATKGTVGYDLNVEKAGQYTFWVRANPLNATLHYKLNGSGWGLVDTKTNKRGEMNIAADNKPDMRFIAWIKVGKVELKAGANTLDFQFGSAAQNHGAIDAFCLTTDAWVPSGTNKPGQGAGGSEEPVGPDKAIWLEGEDAISKTTKPHNWYDSVKGDALSGGVWLGHFDNSQTGMATYEFNAEVDDDYTFWVRANPLNSKVVWQLDDNPPQTLIWKDNERGRMNIAKDNKPDMRFIAWAKAGKVKLAKGKHTLKLTLSNNGKGPQHGGVDALAFVRIPWVPSGAKRPSIRKAGDIKPDTWFPVVGDDDEFAANSIIDMSRMVPAPAGKFGHVQRKGEDMVFSKSGDAVKFWAVGAGVKTGAKPEDLAARAKWYRKHGINLVRQHTVVGATGLPDANGKFDKAKIDTYDRWFAECKKQGIYTTWSVIYPHHGAWVRKGDLPDDRFEELKKLDKRGAKHGIIRSNDYINFDRELQDSALKIFTALLNHTNPYTGMKYKDDPALAVVEFQNEANMFFHTINDLRNKKKTPVYGKMVRGQFFEWAKAKYKTKDALKKAWGTWDKHDNWDAGELGLMVAYHWGADGPGYEFKGQMTRAQDQMRWMVSVQKGYYDRREKEIRGLGFKGTTVTTAWRGIGFSSLPNLYSDTAADMIDRHNYFGGGDGGHRITEGKVKNHTHLDQPGRGILVLGLSQVAGRPFAVSEWSMMPPAPYKAEAAPLVGFYGVGLQGWDASYHFATGSKRLGDGWPGLGKYVSHTPHYMGQFPAITFAIHNGHIQEGDVVANRAVKDNDIFSARDVLGQSLGGEHDAKTIGGNAVTSPEALAIGKVLVDFEGSGSKADLNQYWDKTKKVLNSTTGQLRWDYGKKVVEVRTKKTQAIIGFAGGKSYTLPGADVSVKTSFVSLMFTPLDNADLDKSKHILITAMARDKQTGAVYNEDWSQLKVMGAPPLLMEPVQATISLKGGKPASVKAVDIYGVPTDREVIVGADGAFTIDGTHQAYYYEVKR